MKYLFLCLLLLFGTTTYAQVDDNKPAEEEEIDLGDIDFDEQADTIDVDIDDIDEDVLSSRSSFPWNKFSVGGQLGGLQFGNVTNVGISPEIIYNVNDVLAFGVDGVLEIYKVNRIFTWQGQFDVNYRETNTGGRVFTRVSPVKSFPIFAQIEYERLNQTNPYYRDDNFNFYAVDQKLNNIGAGLGFYNGPYYLALMYNFMNKDNKQEFRELGAQDFFKNFGQQVSPSQIDDRNYSNAIAFRTGLNIPLGQGNKNKRRDKNKKKKDREAQEYR